MQIWSLSPKPSIPVEGRRMIELASGLILIPVLLSAPGDLEANDSSPWASAYHLCVPWAVDADPRTWDDVVGYYTEPPFVLSEKFQLLPSAPAAPGGRPVVVNTVAANPLNDDGDAVNRQS